MLSLFTSMPSKARFFFALTCLLFLMIPEVKSQIVSFNHITQEHGLRNGNVRAIIKDHQGFVWIGTEDGLHRYDGYSMKIYRKDENDSTSINSNFILCLFEDSEKNLWIGTLDGSLCLYDRKKDSFINFKKQISNDDSRINETIRVIYEDRDKQLFIGSGQLLRGAVTDHPHSIQFREVKLPINTETSADIRVMDISEYINNQLLVSINNVGLFIYDSRTDKFSEHSINRLEKNIQTIYFDKKRELIWLGTWKSGLLVCNYGGDKYKRIQKGTDKHSIQNNYIPELTADLQGNLWIATDHGLSMIEPNCNPLIEPLVKTYLPDPQNHSSIRGVIIKAVYVDPEDNLWVGTYFNGINFYDKHSTHFGGIVLSDKDQSASDFQSATALIEDRSHHLWAGTDGAGLYFSKDSFGDSPAVFERITSCPGVEKIKSMKLDGNQNLWIATWGHGLYRFNTLTHECLNFESFKTGVDIGKEILSLEIDPLGDVWIGAFEKGVFRFSQKTKTITHLTGKERSSGFIDRVNVIMNGSHKDVWIGREGRGLNHTIIGSDQYDVIETAHILASTSVSSLYIDKEETLWIGCPSKGLVHYDSKKNTSTLYTEQDGLVNSMIYGMLEDSRGRLWISTEGGISVLLDKKIKKFVNFGKANGLLSNQFNRLSILSTYNDYFVFGNLHGISFINPSLLLSGVRNSPIVFTRLFIDNKEQVVGAKGSILEENVSIANEIHLDHKKNSFSVEVALLDYDFSHQSKYYYKLEGFDHTWQYAGSLRQIHYTNLKPEKYQLKISSSKTPDVDGSSMATLGIIIHPAWWQTTTFKSIVAILIVLLSLGTHRIRVQYLVSQKKNLEKKVQQRTERLNRANDLLQTKLLEINSINTILSQQQIEIVEKNNEILTQNEELTAQNEQIADQHESLIEAQHNLRDVNSILEKTVDERTQTLQKTIDHLNKTVFELDRFVYSASHDLSAPLKSILGLVQIIHLEKDNAKLEEYVALIKSTVLKLEAVIKSMVDYARNSHVQVKTDKFNLHELIGEVSSELIYLPEASKLVLENQIPENLLIQNDQARVKVIFHNLLGNGIKYMDRNKSSNLIKIEAYKKDSNTIVRVSDNGIGIKAEFLDKIFNMYFRATEMSKGSGLGLFIVKETINKIGGDITVQSTIGVGSTFEVTLPEMSEQI
jgi:ligand-binding sensor domain-containing protein/signal transduction histidine kinase